MNRAVFWDRDGVLNEVLKVRDDGLKNVSPQKFRDFKIAQGAAEVLSKIKAAGYLNIIVTNQPDVERNKMSWQELNLMHDFLKQHAPTVDAIYVCPHDGSENCHCRKPKPGLLLDAAKDYHVDLLESFTVGDAQRDIDAGKAAGVKTILYRTEYNTEISGQDFSVKNLSEILKIIK